MKKLLFACAVLGGVLPADLLADASAPAPGPDATPVDPDPVQALLDASEAQNRRQRLDEALRILEHAEPFPDPRDQARVLTQRGSLALRLGRLDDAAALVAQAVPRAREAGDPEVLGRAQMTQALLAQARTDPDTAFRLLQEAEASRRTTRRRSPSPRRWRPRPCWTPGGRPRPWPACGGWRGWRAPRPPRR